MKTQLSYIILLFLFLSFIRSGMAQDAYSDYGFTRNQTVSVVAGDTLRLPWCGGMNGVRFSEIDLDLNGQLDLVAFEKHGNRILPFIFTEKKTYRYAPQYVRCFPKVHDWMILKDYNQDRKPDIFTYGLAGISLYKNVSDTALAFQLVTDQLQSFYYKGYVNIFSSPDDYVAIEDVDHDGQLDLLNFWVLGKYMHQQRNYATNPDSLDFHLQSECWGHFAEGADNNIIELFTDCDSKSGEEPTRHVGSTMLAHDFDGDGLLDLLLGDIDSPNLVLLHNGGTMKEARMTSQDVNFPNNTTPVQLYSMPAPSLCYDAVAHADGQEHPVLIVSPADPSLTKSQDLNSVWRYDYDELLQQYTLTNQAFLQEDMLDVGSGARPVLYDWNQDGLLDLFVANYGSYDSSQVINGFLTSYFSSSVHYFQNTGTREEPRFELKNSDFGMLKSLNFQSLHPTFGDFDGDGLTDMLCGQKDGTLILVPNGRLSGNADIRPVVHFLDIDVGNNSTPQSFDLNQDGLDDLLIGNQRGTISYYRNNGNGRYDLVTDYLGEVDVRNQAESYFGYSVPCFYRDCQQGTRLWCGSEQGNIYYYKDIDGHLDEAFALSETVVPETVHGVAFPLMEGRHVAVAVAELNGDDFPDMLVGNYAGGLAYLEGSKPRLRPTGIEEHRVASVRVYPNPTTGKVNIDSELPIRKVVVYDCSGRILTMENRADQLNLSSLAPGIYLLEIQFENNRTERVKVVRGVKGNQ